MSKRANGEGSTRRLRNGRWEARWWGRDGRRHSRTARTQSEAARILRDEIRRREDGLPAVPRSLAVETFLTRDYLEARRHEIRPSTWTRAEELVRLHITPAIGRVKLANLTPGHVQRLIADRLTAGYSPRTVQQIHGLLRHALKRAQRWGLVGQKVAALVDPPRIPRRRMSFLDEDQVRRFLAAVDEDRLRALYVLAITTGMRQGELFGLRWADVDLPNRRLSVRGTLTGNDRDGPVITETKTGRNRQILLTDLGTDALQRHRVNQLEERLRAGSEWVDHDLVFTNELGRPLHVSNLTTRSFRRALERAGLPQIRFHDLRHTAATLMLGRGVHPKVVSEMLGHAQISITLDLYSHVTPTMQATAVEALDDVLAST
jgi:integrase